MFRSSRFILCSGLLAAVALLSGCATETHRAIKPQTVATYHTDYHGKKAVLLVGAFENRSDYQQGIFAAGGDRLGRQAKTILKTHLQQTNRFQVVNRESLEKMKHEAELRGIKQKLQGARYAVMGAVTEFGRKETGSHQLFGILGSSKQQTAYAKVSLNIVDVKTSTIVYSTQGAGEYSLSNREVVGFGGHAGYDATLNGKVLNFAIIEVVNNLVRDIQNGTWVLKP